MFNNQCSECGKKTLSKTDLKLILNPNIEMCYDCNEHFITNEQSANETYEQE